MRLHGYMCDAGCGATGQSKATQQTPEGWLIVFPGGLHFCGWSCVRTYANDRGLPARTPEAT